MYSKKFLVTFTFLLTAFLSSDAFSQVKVKGYYRSDGTYVKPHYRSSPDSTVNNNWSTEGNVNPYTGKEGYLPRENSTYTNYQEPGYDPSYSGSESDTKNGCFTQGDSICSSNAHRYIGEVKRVCDTVAHIHQFSRGFYLNLAKPFPDQNLTVVLWDNMVHSQTEGVPEGVYGFLNKRVCVKGEISMYRGRLDITPDYKIEVMSVH